METRVYKLPEAVANRIIDDPDVKRYGEAKKFDPSVLGLGGDGVVLIVRGNDKVFGMEPFKGLEELKDNKKEILRKVDDLSNAAASGVGMLFG